MLNKLSVKFQKEIALSLISIFFISGFASLKAQVLVAYHPERNSYTAAGFHRAYNRHQDNFGITSYPAPSVAPDKINALLADSNAMTFVSKANAQLNNLYQDFTVKNRPFIGGPGQPEMASYKPVGADNMVSTFTGDFSYNIPLMDVGGYPVNMFYNSGITMDQDASWVGLGWNINPGTVNRNMRGLPDDFDGSKGDIITKRQSTRPDKTWGVTGGAGVKFAGLPLVGLGIDVNAGLSFNNKLGVAVEAGIHPSLSISSKNADSKTSGMSYGATVGAALNLSSRNGASITPSISFDATKHDGDVGTTASLGASYTYSSRLGVEGMHLDAGLSKSKTTVSEHFNNETGETEQSTKSGSGSIASLSSSLSFVYPTVTPSIRNIFTRKSYNLSFGVGGEVFGLNAHARIAGFYTETKIADADKETTHPAYGMLHFQDAEKDPQALLDFNRLNDGVYTPGSPAIALPIYTYDVFSISGEGTGGSFRAYRSDIGYMRDPNVKTRDDASSLGLDIGFGNTIHGGAEFSYAFTPTEVSAWKMNNAAAGVLKFTSNSGSYQAAYFKNPGEKTVPDADFQNAIGGEDLVRFKMANIASGTPMLLPSLMRYDATLNNTGEQALTSANTLKLKRDKRTQVISFLTAEEAARIGFDKKIYIYNTDTNKVIFSGGCSKAGIDSITRTENGSFRKAHHISEIDVLGTDGRKYVYGLPVYNTMQKDVSFAIDNGDTTSGKSHYTPGVDDGASNTKGRDWYMQQEETPAYTHSFLLTELVSPNYVDVTGNGISEDDMGDAVKFNYSKFEEGFKWRTPTADASATYSEGLKTDQKDDKAHYVYGEREMFLLYSIESKNMVARFYVKDDRKDCRGVLGQQGGRDDGHGMRRLDKICLYSKADLVKFPNGVGAKPIKTVKFFQSYRLCQGAESSVNGYGKLTLDSIWVTYNGNSKKAKSRYVFYYPADNNPAYDFNSNDRWGNYKKASDNPGNLLNADYPYTIQDTAKANKYVAAWMMNRVLLPSGGVINVQYESDDYGYVQNRKAACMNTILGFGSSTAPNLSSPTINQLYNGGGDNEYVYVQLSYPISAGSAADKQKELAARYFDNVSQLYMKLAVKMPSGGNVPGLAGSEMIPVYADIDSYGLVSASVAWVKVKKVQGNTTPMTQQALQFLKQQLPGKAYQSYDMSENSGMKAIVLALGGALSSIGSLKMGDDNSLKAAGKCREVETARSFARLNNPILKKVGGGLRVKRVLINDNWNKMTGQYEATYGQEYKYTTTELINNKLCTISSGVAAWEPSVGGDENPHKEIMRFLDHNKGGPYDFGAIDMPLGEALYPTPMVGYSRVEILSVHRDTVKNLPTRQVTEFYTTKDFPFRSSCTQLSDPTANVKYAPSAIKQLLHLDMQKAITQSQGFLVDMNDMNGKEKIQATYSALDSINPVSYSQNYYNIEKATDNTYKFNHTFPVISSAEGKISNALIGRDIEIMADFRQHTSETVTTNISPNFDFFFLGIFPVPLTNILQPTIYEGTTYRSASLLKIVNHYGMLDSVVSIDKGSMVSTKNMVYDAETGNPLITRTNNEHNKPIYNFSYPAHWAYTGMGAAYKNIDANYTGLNFSHGKLLNMPPDLNSIIESGDEFYTVAQNNLSIDFVAPCDAAAGSDPWSTLAQNTEKKIWAVNTSKVNSTTPQWVFMDKYGNPYNAKGASVRIVRSGHRNMMDQTVGSITSMNNPIDNSGQLQFADATNIVQTAAATFKDSWRVDNAFYTIDSTVVQTRWAPVRDIYIAPVPTKSYSVGLFRSNCSNCGYQGTHFPSPEYLLARKQSFGSPARHSKKKQKSWILFDFDHPYPNYPVTANSVILSAKLSLYAHSLQNAGSITHNFFYQNSHGNANDYGHGNGDPHTYSNTNNNNFKINRMIGYWPANYSGDWEGYHFNGYEINNPDNQVAVAGTQPNSVSSKSWDYNTMTGDNRIEFTSVFRGMLRDKLDPSRQYATGIKLSMLDDGDFEHDAKVCFYATNVYNGHLPWAPSINVKYYSCADAYPYGYVPSDYEEVVKCSDTTFHATYCRSKFTQKKSINPYVEGILGNWRVDTTYAYYGDRKESDPNVPVDTRTGGSILNYKKFWIFAASATGQLSRNYAAADVWVWNSTITQYNRKGYEIENKDPLGRFNSGIYGYNQQLPIAVANNARVREVLFDGFEDYAYATEQNCNSCKPHRYFTYDANIINSLDTTQHHTGRYSMKIAAGQSIAITAPVTSLAEADNGYALRLKVDSTYTQAGSYGLGLKAEYFNNLGLIGTPVYTYADQTPNFSWVAPYVPVPGLHPDDFSVRWTGKLKPSVTSLYTFQASAFNNVRISINGYWILTSDWSVIGTPGSNTATIGLQAGQFYDIVIEYQKWQGNASNLVQWKWGAQPFAPIDNYYLFSPTNIYTTTNVWCARLDSVNVRGNALTDTFSLLQGKKMLVSAWVKEGGNDCKCKTYVNNKITVSYPDLWQGDAPMYPTGSIIEGWQRYEGIFNVPVNAASVRINFSNTTGGAPVYFDDVRIHPFNANLKSFVYHSSNLRLMSELDENNYASFYEYDNDGTLTRVKKETEQGIKTITETRSAMQQAINP